MPQRVSRLPSGLSTAPPETVWGQFYQPYPMAGYSYANDFSTYAAGDWTVTSTNSGTSALIDGEGGQIALTTGATATNYQANELVKKSFYMVTGYRHWFQISFKVSNATNTAIYAGWIDTLAGPLAPGSGVYFYKANGSTTMNLIMNNATVTSSLAVGTIAASTWYNVGWYYDGASNPSLKVYSSIGLTLPVLWEGQTQYSGGVLVNAASANSTTTLDNLPAASVGHTMGFGLSTGTNSAYILTVDHCFAGSQVNRF
jgi:hypothetical protein